MHISLGTVCIYWYCKKLSEILLPNGQTQVSGHGKYAYQSDNIVLMETWYMVWYILNPYTDRTICERVKL
jgi:hypothetical protein